MTLAALALSGGGALGAAHLGVVSILEKRGFKFDHFTGVSAGAIVVALLAVGHSATEAYSLFKSRKMRHLVDLASFHHGIVRGTRVLKAFDEVFGNSRIEELEFPLVIGATDFQNGERILLRRGRVADALRASVSVPVLFEPFFHPEEQRWLVDGGITQNFPLDVPILEYKGSKIVGVDVASSLDESVDFSKKGKRMRLLASTMSRTFRIIFRSQQQSLPEDSRVLRIDPDTSEFTASDIFKMDQIFAKGSAAVEQCVAN